MAQNLPKYLKLLNECLPGSKYGISGNCTNAFLISGDIIRDCQQLSKDSDVANAVSILFNMNDGLVIFLKKSVKHDQLEDTRIKIIEFFQEFIGNYPSFISSHAIEIKDALFMIFNHNKKAKMRILVLKVIIKLIISSSGKQVGIDLNPVKIMEKFILELTSSKITPTVLQVILELLGIIFETFPEHVNNYYERLLKIFLFRLNQQMKSKIKAPELPVICGCFSGINSLLNVMGSELSDDDRISVYNYIVLAIGHNKDLKRFEYIRIVLNLFGKHAILFEKLIYKEWLKIYLNLKEWAYSYSNESVKMAANFAIESYFKHIASALCKQLELSSDFKSEVQNIFCYFTETFCDILRSNETENIAMAIKGYGFFAAPCKLLMDKEKVNLMFSEVIRRCEDLFFSDNIFMENKISYLPSFINALANILIQLDEVLGIFVPSLEKLAIALIEHYPRIAVKRKEFAWIALIKLLISLYPKRIIFKPFIKKIVYQGILRTCSHPIPQDLSLRTFKVSHEDVDDTISFRNYIDLWKTILQLGNLKELNEMGLTIADREIITQTIYNEIISSVLCVINKLDFSVVDTNVKKLSIEVEANYDSVNEIQASKPKDFQVFVNLVEFCKVFLLENHLSWFENWICKFGYCMIDFSTKFPLVSGFYKLFAVVLKICHKVEYFENLQMNEVNLASSSNSINLNVKFKCFVIFSKSAKEICFRLRQYKDDLLISCFQVILSLPKEIIADIVPVLVPVLSKAVLFGYVYLPVIEEVLTALEVWSIQISSETCLPIYKDIIPLLNGYLTDFSHLDIGNEKAIASKNVLTESVTSMNVSTSRSLELKLRIVKFLGVLGNNFNSLLVDTRPENIAKLAVAWDTKKFIKFDVPFLDMKPTIYLDEFLPKVIELTKYSSDRQTKVVACEVFHALILYLIGSRASLQPKLQNEKPISNLLKEIFPAVFKLACDPDLVILQLFKPLMFQLIHWFSSNRKEISDDRVILFDSMIDGITNDTDVSLRDLCAHGVKELMQWTIKHTSDSDLKKNPLGIKLILKRVYKLSIHPKASMRLGAAYIFNNIYMVFREENDLVDCYIFEILYYFIESLAMSENDFKHIGTRDQCLLVINHIEKIILKSATILKKKNSKRRMAIQLQGMENNDWENVIMWLINQFGRQETECRHCCMNLLNKFVAISENVSDYLKLILLKKGAAFFINIFEGQDEVTETNLKLARFPLMTDYLPLSDHFSITGTIAWFELLLSSLDCYTYVIGNNFLNPSDFFSSEVKSVLLKGINYFNSEISLMELFCLAKRHKLKSDLIFTPGEIYDFYRAKCTVVVRIMDFVGLFVKTLPQYFEVILKNVLDASFFKMIISCIFYPLKVGFDMDDNNVSSQLPQTIHSLLSILEQYLPNSYASQFQLQLSDEITTNQIWSKIQHVSNYITDCKADEQNSFRWLIAGFKTLKEANLLQPLITSSKMGSSNISNSFVDISTSMCFTEREGFIFAKDLDRLEKNIAVEVLLLSFSFGLPVERLIILIADQLLVTHVTDQTKLLKGGHILMTFKSEVNVYLMETADKSIPYLMTNMARQELIFADILISILDCLKYDLCLRKKYSDRVINNIFLNWRELSSWWHPKSSNDLKEHILGILTRALALDSKLLMNGDQLRSTTLDTFLALILDPCLTLKIKICALDILSIYTCFPLKEHLVKMMLMHFPLRSSEIDQKSFLYKDYISLFKRLLMAFDLSKSLALLEFLIEVVCIEQTHVCDEYIQKAISLRVSRSTNEFQASAIELVYAIYVKNIDGHSDFQQNVVEKFLIPFLLKANKVVFINFFVTNVKDLTNFILKKPLKSSDENYQPELISKICTYKLIEILYCRCSSEELITIESKINSAFCGDFPKSGKELTQAITKAALGIKKENMIGETAFLELRRLVRCAAYNCLVAVVSCTQTDVKFYTGFLFTENPLKGDFLWENLIDVNRKYTFDIEFSRPIKKIKPLTSMGHDVQNEENGDVLRFEPFGNDHTLKFLEGSSLVEDISQFNFSSTKANEFQRSKKAKIVDISSQIQKVEKSENYMELEMDELNQQECMLQINRLLQFLIEKITPVQSDSSDSLPSWMKAMHKSFTDDTSKGNVKLFLVRLIANNENLFRPYAKFWLIPILQWLVQDFLTNGLNYFASDVIVIILSWSPQTLPADNLVERGLATKLLEFLIKNSFHERRDIVKHNLEIIRLLIECWKTRIDIPTQSLYESFSSSSLGSKCQLVGIHVVGIIVSFKISPYSPTVGLDENKFLNTLANNILANFKEIYSTTAEVVGLILNFIQKREMSNEFSFFKLVQKHLSKLETNMDQFLVCIYEIHKSFPEIVDDFIPKLVFHMPKSRNIFRLLGLKVLMSRIEFFEGLYKELISIGFYNFLAHDDEGIQKVCLMIIQKVIKKLTIEELVSALEHVKNFVSHPDVECRKIMFEILIDVFNQSCEEDSDRKNCVKNVLLMGLKDEDLNIRLLLLSFWGDEMRLPTSTLERLFGILGLLYLPECEKNFLETSTYLMLELTSKSLDFNRFIFENPLSDCKFENYNVNTDWQVRHASMMPLFVETMPTDSLESMQLNDSETSVNSSQIRATQENLVFTQTQQNEPQTSDWLTQSYGESFSSGTSSFSYSSNSRSLYKLEKLSKFNLLKNVGEAPGEEIDKSTISLLKRRFIKNVNSQKIFYVKRNLKLQQRRVNLVHEQKSARDAKISIYRKYRKGDLPDIQILFSAIILPLQILAQRNNLIAELLFTNLTIGILNELRGSSNKEPLTKIENYLNGMLKETTYFTPSVILAIQKIVYEFCGYINIDVGALTSASENSFTHNTGILLLEKILLRNFKNKNNSNVVGEHDCEKYLWVNLARLNKSQKNYDVVNGIVTNHFGLPPEAREILEEEANGNYSSALNLMKKFYKNVQSHNEVEDDSSEIDIWNESTLLCYHELCQWEKLSNWSLNCFEGIDSENLSEIWNKLNYERFLPYFIKANVKLIMEGEKNQSFIDFLDNSKNDLIHPERKQYLETRFSQELALVSIVQKDYNLAWHYNYNSLKNFIHYWISISSLSFVHQFSHLEQLQSIVELTNFLDTLKLSSSDFPSSVRALLESWKSSLPNVSAKTSLINDIISNRTLYMQRFENAISSSSVIDDYKSENFINLFSGSRFDFSVNCIESANLQGSFSLALSHLKRIMNIYKKTNDDSLQQRWILLYCKTHQQRLLSLDLKERVDSLQNIWSKLAKYITADEVDLSIKIESQIISSKNANLCLNLLNENSELVADFEDDFFERINCSSSADADQVKNGLVKHSYNCLKKAVSLTSLKEYRNVENIADAHLQLAKFCDRLLQDNASLRASKVIQIGVSLGNIAIEVVDNLLKSIKFGNEESIQLFCRLLQILESFPQTHKVFIELVKEIPVWMFLRWNGQLVALLDNKCAVALHQLILSIAETYPLALFYSFNVSKQGFTFEKSNEGRINKAMVEKLESIFDRLTLVKDFILALEQLDHPCSRLKDFCSQLTVNDKKEKILERFLNYYKIEIENQKIGNKVIAKTTKEFVKKVQPLFEQTFGRNNSNLKMKSAKEIIEALRRIYSNVDNLETIGPKLVKDYCVWLGEFSSNKFCTKLEIPGQYTGYSKPLPEYHVKIEKFNEQMNVLPSKAKPKAISLIGNDYKEYKYLIKSGEDLRLDQRIQQLLNIMNGIYQRDEACKSRQFRIITYQVVPLTLRLGWLEWMPNTIALKNFLEMSMNEEEKSYNNSCAGMIIKFLQSIYEAKDFNHTLAFQYFYLKCDFTQSSTQFKKILERSPSFALKNSLWNLSSSPEAFITLRNRFIVSHSVLCISHYILGVGDRHLSNFLVSLKSGEIIGIDFGHSFGTGISVLPLPELMPFRLTVQFLNLMEPLKEHGLIQRSMVHALNALRKNSEILINSMDIFIKEPSIDWQIFAKKQSKEMMSSEDCTWYPTQKVEFAKQKLEGRNCAYIIIDELKNGIKRDPKIMEKYKEVCVGVEQKSLRSTLGDKKLTTEKQVLCLIEQATDSNILSKTWFGWSPWL